MSHDVISTNLKKYEQIGADTYKILVSYYYSGSKLNKEVLGERDFAPVIEEMFENKLQVVANSLVDYSAIPGDFKTCIVKAKTRIIPVSTASLNSFVESAGFEAVAKNIFVDPATNEIWKKVVTESGIVQLVQTQEDNLEAMMRGRLDISQVVASARPLYALGSNKFDYVFYYNTNSKTVESGIIINSEDDHKVIASRQQKDLVSINPHCLIVVAGVDQLINQFESDLKGSKDAVDVMKAYIDFWFKSSDGKDTADEIEGELKKTVLKSTSSLAGGSEVKALLKEVRASDEMCTSDEKPTKEEIETIINTKFDKEKLASFAYVDSLADSECAFVICLTKPVSVDDLTYIFNTAKEVFKVEPGLETTDELVHIKLCF